MGYRCWVCGGIDLEHGTWLLMELYNYYTLYGSCYITIIYMTISVSLLHTEIKSLWVTFSKHLFRTGFIFWEIFYFHFQYISIFPEWNLLTCKPSNRLWILCILSVGYYSKIYYRVLPGDSKRASIQSGPLTQKALSIFHLLFLSLTRISLSILTLRLSRFTSFVLVLSLS